MGTNYYVVIPKLKLMIHLGRHIQEEEIDQDLEKFNNFLNLWNKNFEGDIPSIYEIEEKTLKGITFKDITILLFYISEVSGFLGLQNSPDQISYYKIARHLDKQSYVISEYSEKINELREKKYEVLDEDERS